MKMTVGELIGRLEEYEPDSEVRLAHQPNWPFEYGISEIVEVDLNRVECPECEGDGCEECGGEGTVTDDPEKDQEQVVYIAEAGQIGYLPGAASRELGWR